MEKTKKKRGRKPGSKNKTKKVSRKDLAISNEWYKKLREDEIGRNNGEEFVYFKGLCRLSQEAGQVSEKITKCEITPIIYEDQDGRTKYKLIAQIAVEICFDDGTTWCGSADAHVGNCQKYAEHPTALAETRALARAKRRALGINEVVSYEEISDAKEDEVNGPANSSQIALIERLCKKLGVKPIDIIEEVTKREDVISVKHLNYGEAQEASRILNDMVADKEKQRRKDERRKKSV